MALTLGLHRWRALSLTLLAGSALNCGYVGLDFLADPEGGLGGEMNVGGSDSSRGDGDGDAGSGGDAGDGDGDTSGSGGDDGGVGGSDGSGGEPEGSGGSDTGAGGDDGGGGGRWGGGGDNWGGGGRWGGGGGSTSDDCLGGDTADFALVGWAAQGTGTTGGKGGTTVTVTTGTQLMAALENKSAGIPLTILVNGPITQGNSSGVDKIDVKDVRDVSIIGVGTKANFNGIGLKLWKTGNVVLRNLTIHHVQTGEKDAISIAGPADHIWVDHCELYSNFQGVEKDMYDGLIDAKDSAEYITYSWNYLHDHWKVSLAGSTETDVHDRKLTMHHNWIENVNGDGPTYRGGQGHIFNNYYRDVASMAVNSRLEACVRVEGNVFSNVVNPWVTAYSAVSGGVELICNELDGNSYFEYAANIAEAPACQASISYDYSDVLTHPDHVETLVTQNAGVGKLIDPTVF